MKKNERARRVLEARKLLKLRSSATLTEIKDAYREMAREIHPDARPPEERPEFQARMRELNAAYETLMDYCTHYAFSFAEEAVEKQCRKRDPLEYWKERFVE